MSYYRTALHEFDNIEIKDDIGINNAGCYMFDTFDSTTNRPDGRLDYQMIFIESGIGHFYIDKKNVHVTSNHVIIYHPNETQKYTYYGTDKTRAYWIHFGGTQVEHLLKSLGLNDTHILKFEKNAVFIDTINYIIDELKSKKSFYQLKCTARLLELLISIHRYNYPPAIQGMNETIQYICKYISENYQLPSSNTEYAAMCNMCPSYFLKLFKRETGTTPQQYKMIQRINLAKQLLMNSNNTISEIASLIGYSDALYFSRVFKKATGISPTQYVQLHKE